LTAQSRAKTGEAINLEQMKVSGSLHHPQIRKQWESFMSRNCHRFVLRRQFTKGVSVRYLGWRPVPKHGSTNNVLDWEGSPDRHKNSK